MPFMRPSAISQPLLSWYDRFKRDLPWRVKNGKSPDPYRVWLSEVMLQQTTVAAVTPRYERFLTRWPTVEALAAASDEDVLGEWAGLGYYARARNLLKCARTVTREYNGRFPGKEIILNKLPGIGPYTAAAIAAIAFDQPSSPVDANIERVTSRLFKIDTPLPTAKTEINSFAKSMTPKSRPGDFAQAMMDLGATVCLPQNPRCSVCPLLNFCKAKQAGLENSLPIKPLKAPKPTRSGQIYWIENKDGDVLLRRRKPNGLLGGMAEMPSFGWSDDDGAAVVQELTNSWIEIGTINHIFTHFRLELQVFYGNCDCSPPSDCFWQPIQFLTDVGLPSVMKKVVSLVLSTQR